MHALDTEDCWTQRQCGVDLFADSFAIMDDEIVTTRWLIAAWGLVQLECLCIKQGSTCTSSATATAIATAIRIVGRNKVFPRNISHSFSELDSFLPMGLVQSVAKLFIVWGSWCARYDTPLKLPVGEQPTEVAPPAQAPKAEETAAAPPVPPPTNQQANGSVAAVNTSTVGAGGTDTRNISVGGNGSWVGKMDGRYYIMPAGIDVSSLFITYSPQPAKVPAKARPPKPVASFLQLSRDIHISLLLEWIPFGKEYSALDVAMCSHRIRKLWLDLLRDPVLRVDLSFEAAPDPSYYAWQSKRDLNISVLHLNTNKCHFGSYSSRHKSVNTAVLMGTQGSDASFTAYGYADILKQFSNLTKVTSRSFVGSLGSKSLQELCTLTVPLKVLEIVDPGTDTCSKDTPFHLCVFELVFRFGNTLEVLHLSIASLASFQAPDDQLLRQIRSRCPRLCALRLPGINFYYQDVLDISESHPNLTALECKVDFSRCAQLNPCNEACLAIMGKFHGLELLSVLGCRVRAASVLLDEYPKLKVFATDEVCVNVTAACSSFTINSTRDRADAQLACQFLLDMSTSVKTIACSVSNFQGTVDNAVLLAIAAKHGDALERFINFHFATSMDNASLEQFLMLCPRISIFEMPRSSHLTCDAVFHVADHCNNLVSLVMSIPNVVDSAVCALLTRCTKLKKLCLPGELLTSAVFDHCAQLKMLALSSRQLQFTIDETISAITGGKFRKLQVLRICQSDLLRYVSAAMRVTAPNRKLKVEEYKHAKDFL